MQLDINALVFKAFVATWTVVIPALGWTIIWFIRKDRTAFFHKLREHETQLEKLKESVDGLESIVYGPNGDDGVNKWENKMRNIMLPFTSRLDSMNERLSRFGIALARAVPAINLNDLQ